MSHLKQYLPLDSKLVMELNTCTDCDKSGFNSPIKGIPTTMIS